MRRKDVQNKTREILRTEPYSRENDGYLIRRVIEELVILHNELWEDGICTWNMFAMIQEIFELEDDEYISDVFYKLRKKLISYKEIDEAYENLGLKRSDT